MTQTGGGTGTIATPSSSNSYGTVGEVAANTPRYLVQGAFTIATRPTLAQVEKWIDTCSATLNTILASAGFTIPIVQPDAALACGQIVVEAVSDLVNNANSSGRFFSDKSIASGSAPMAIIRKDMEDWVTSIKYGFSLLGVARTMPVQVVCTVTNPQYERTVNDNNAFPDGNEDEIGVLNADYHQF